VLLTVEAQHNTTPFSLLYPCVISLIKNWKIFEVTSENCKVVNVPISTVGIGLSWNYLFSWNQSSSSFHSFDHLNINFLANFTAFIIIWWMAYDLWKLMYLLNMNNICCTLREFSILFMKVGQKRYLYLWIDCFLKILFQQWEALLSLDFFFIIVCCIKIHPFQFENLIFSKLYILNKN